MGDTMERCATGIDGFDKISQGGFIRNSTNVLVGGPGSGKTTFLLQFLWNGVKKFEENGLYCSFEPDILETVNDARSFGWDFGKLGEEGKIKFLKFSPTTSIDELKTELTKLIAQGGIRRICFDPISVLALNLSEQGKIRNVIFELASLMKRLNVTTILADESMEAEGMQAQTQGEWTKTDIIRFLSDSVTVLYESGISGVGDRAIRISKMRRTAHDRKPQGMQITPKGIEILEAPKEQEIAQSPVVESQQY
jgi:circadian clock protein KaiC